MGYWIFFRGTRTAQTIRESSVTYGSYIIVAADDDRLREQSDVTHGGFAKWLERAYTADRERLGHIETITVACNGGPTATAFAVVAHLVEQRSISGDFAEDGEVARYNIRLLDIQREGIALLGLWGSEADVEDAIAAGWADKRCK